MARIFISYSRSDKSIIDGLIRQLEAAGHPVWVDRTGIRGGEQWRQEIVEAIESSDVFLLVLSENSAGSDNVRAEIDLAKESRKKIIPINLRPVPIPSSMKYQLAGLQRINCFPNAEDGFQELLNALNEGKEPEAVLTAPVAIHAVRHPSKLRSKGVYISGIVALVVVLSTVAFLFLNGLNGSAKNSPPLTQPVEQSHAVDQPQPVRSSAQQSMSSQAILRPPRLSPPSPRKFRRSFPLCPLKILRHLMR
jgi:hypothetical protein